MHSSETCPIRLFASAGKIFSYCRHSLAERILPVDVGLDAVAVADVHGGGAAEPVDGAVERLDAPARHLVHEHVESRLVELDHVDAVCLKRARFLVEQAGESERHFRLVAVMRSATVSEIVMAPGRVIFNLRLVCARACRASG